MAQYAQQEQVSSIEGVKCCRHDVESTCDWLLVAQQKAASGSSSSIAEERPKAEGCQNCCQI